MKGVILAGGTGSRLWPLTEAHNKHLLPVWDRLMVDYPLQYLRNAGLTDVRIVTGKDHCGDFAALLQDGKSRGLTSLSYAVQPAATGIADALKLAKDFAGDDNIAVLLGDNIFQDKDIVKKAREEYKGGALVVAARIPDAELYAAGKDGKLAAKYGMLVCTGNKVVGLVEKPSFPSPSNWAVTGLYLYDHRAFDIANKLKPSKRGELEITDVNQAYLERGELEVVYLEGWWGDAGESIAGMYNVSDLVRKTPEAQLEPVKK